MSPGVALLPFVDERRLRAALEEVYPDLTPEESKAAPTGWHSLCDTGFMFAYKLDLFISFVNFFIKEA